MCAQRRGPWSNEEDMRLLALIEKFGGMNWVRISESLGSRSPKQCRERYHQNLKPSLNHEPISTEEGAMIEHMVGKIGKRWAEIARQLPGRSDNAVKNWWNGSKGRRMRGRQETSGHHHQQFGPNAYPRPSSQPQRQLPTPVRTPTDPQSPSNNRYADERWAAPLPSPTISETASYEYHEYNSPQAWSRDRHGSVNRLPALRINELPGRPELRPGSEEYLYKMEIQDNKPSSGEILRRSPLDPGHGDVSGRSQLPTAPNSPISTQCDQRFSSTTKPDRDVRMALSSLLSS